MWTRRAALVMTLPWARLNNLRPEDAARRERILGWAAAYVPDRDWFIQKAVAWWLRDLSKHDAARTRAFLAEHGEAMKPFARKEAARHLT
jgi:3-methyladenine DNA glycosylase AlkD